MLPLNSGLNSGLNLMRPLIQSNSKKYFSIFPEEFADSDAILVTRFIGGLCGGCIGGGLSVGAIQVTDANGKNKLHPYLRNPLFFPINALIGVGIGHAAPYVPFIAIGAFACSAYELNTNKNSS